MSNRFINMNKSRRELIAGRRPFNPVDFISPIEQISSADSNKSQDPLKKAMIDPDRINMNSLIISRQMSTSLLTVGSTPLLVAQPPHVWPYYISNPSLSVGVTNTNVMVDGLNKVAAGNLDLSPVSVAGYTNCHFFLHVTAVNGTWDFFQRTLVPFTASTTYMDVQKIFAGINAIGDYYAPVGNMGIVTDMSVRWIPTAAGNITFSLVAVLKEGSLQTSGSLSKTIYLGGSDVSISNGMPLYEGESKTIFLGPEITLYAIASAASTLKLITL